MVSTKHLATFLLGAAAGVAFMKYKSMSDEEKEALHSNLKNKADQVKNEAVDAMDKLKDYFEELKSKGGDALKEHMAEAENILNDLFKNKGGKENEPQAT